MSEEKDDDTTGTTGTVDDAPADDGGNNDKGDAPGVRGATPRTSLSSQAPYWIVGRA